MAGSCTTESFTRLATHLSVAPADAPAGCTPAPRARCPSVTSSTHEREIRAPLTVPGRLRMPRAGSTTSPSIHPYARHTPWPSVWWVLLGCHGPARFHPSAAQRAPRARARARCCSAAPRCRLKRFTQLRTGEWLPVGALRGLTWAYAASPLSAVPPACAHAARQPAAGAFTPPITAPCTPCAAEPPRAGEASGRRPPGGAAAHGVRRAPPLGRARGRLPVGGPGGAACELRAYAGFQISARACARSPVWRALHRTHTKARGARPHAPACPVAPAPLFVNATPRPPLRCRRRLSRPPPPPPPHGTSKRQRRPPRGDDRQDG